MINNWLFAAMTEADRQALAPGMRRRVLAKGEVLLTVGKPVDVIHFPATAQITNTVTLEGGQALAVSTVGPDGVTGLAAFVADEVMGWNVVVHVPGVVWSLSAETLRARSLVSPDLNAVLLKALHQNQLEAYGRAICATFHGVLPRLAHWLLTLQDRTGLSRFDLTQEDLAEVLGVQRTTVVAATKVLRSNGAIARGTRGRIEIRDRSALKSEACGCHGRAATTRPSAMAIERAVHPQGRGSSWPAEPGALAPGLSPTTGTDARRAGP